jgi:RNA polymerase sigma-70 factor (ECF subfamily)
MEVQVEQELVKRIKKDPSAFSILYDRYYNPIFTYVFRRLGDYELARDVTAETFLKAYQKIGSFEWRGIPVASWLYRIATNEIKSYFRSSKYKPSYVEDINLHQHLHYEEGIETEKASLQKAFEEAREFVIIQRELVQLRIRYQEVIALRFFEEKTIKEIAEILGRKEGTVKSLLSRGLEKLRIAVAKKIIS